MQFVIRHDRAAVFQFAALDSVAGRRLRAEYEITADSVVLVENGRAYVASEAALRIAARLDAPWNWLPVLRVLPVALRDAVYRWIAGNRYRWFGRRQVCWLPAPELAQRFLE